ncbi:MULTISPECIES: hypothetical protein [Aliiglaciecola]|uniref:hypothetical protein n=1 Tax=Aliiglaciecola TaxID=1406885 RepID=UPI0026E1E348|nr:MULTISPECIES: hypothetical protein [unclassified Aliiglaciecola]MDO6709817.1 hypothetical protein [Aliiglaciecola sp. 2_MG-2023]MDO6750641.1 hypothetical protein [Aliiglaciecola sp. 1_MG-2023]
MLLIISIMSFHASAACDSPAHRQFDFWLGTWDVYSPQHKIVGINKITSQLNGCILTEEYQTPSGYQGQSINIFDVSNQQWHQTWVDNSGLLLSLNGKFDGQSMVLEGPGKTPKGENIVHRITWTPSAGKSVRQHWESSQNNGKTWTTLFDGKYVKRK